MKKLLSIMGVGICFMLTATYAEAATTTPGVATHQYIRHLIKARHKTMATQSGQDITVIGQTQATLTAPASGGGGGVPFSKATGLPWDGSAVLIGAGSFPLYTTFNSISINGRRNAVYNDGTITMYVYARILNGRVQTYLYVYEYPTHYRLHSNYASGWVNGFASTNIGQGGKATIYSLRVAELTERITSVAGYHTFHYPLHLSIP